MNIPIPFTVYMPSIMIFRNQILFLSFDCTDTYDKNVWINYIQQAFKENPESFVEKDWFPNFDTIEINNRDIHITRAELFGPNFDVEGALRWKENLKAWKTMQNVLKGYI